MRLLRQLLLASSLALATTTTHAATYVWDFSQSFQNVLSLELVNDTFEFVLPADSVVTAVSVSFDLSDQLTLSLFDSSGTLLARSDPTYLNSLTEVLKPGSYAKVTGTAPSGYVFSAIAAPVAEPASLALMFGGLGLVGLIAFRSQQA